MFSSNFYMKLKNLKSNKASLKYYVDHQLSILAMDNITSQIF